MKKIRLSLKPIAEARWETEPTTGAKFLIAPLPGDEDHDIQQDSSDVMQNVDPVLFAEKVALAKIKGWEGVGDPSSDTELPANADNIKAFARTHALGIMVWIIRRARSLDHYRQQEIAQAKNA